jgi:hypothetical protein
MLTLCICIILKKPLRAYTLTFIMMFIFGMTWFQPWYLTWLLPLLIVALPLDLFILISAGVILTPVVWLPLDMTFKLGVALLGYYALKLLIKLILPFASKLKSKLVTYWSGLA